MVFLLQLRAVRTELEVSEEFIASVPPTSRALCYVPEEHILHMIAVRRSIRAQMEGVWKQIWEKHLYLR
jgi:hypothetical protein